MCACNILYINFELLPAPSLRLTKIKWTCKFRPLENYHYVILLIILFLHSNPSEMFLDFSEINIDVNSLLFSKRWLWVRTCACLHACVYYWSLATSKFMCPWRTEPAAVEWQFLSNLSGREWGGGIVINGKLSLSPSLIHSAVSVFCM